MGPNEDVEHDSDQLYTGEHHILVFSGDRLKHFLLPFSSICCAENQKQMVSSQTALIGVYSTCSDLQDTIFFEIFCSPLRVQA